MPECYVALLGKDRDIPGAECLVSEHLRGLGICRISHTAIYMPVSPRTARINSGSV